MSENCQLVVFSNKAYNALIRESFDKDPVETGGILLGHVLDNGVWIVMEVLPPGINSIFEYAYFEYDDEFVNYLAQSVANQYKRPLDLLGLWHRHPGSMDVFSSTDDGTNATFALQNPKGVISGLVNIDPRFRLTMYHMDRPSGRLMGRPDYDVVDVEVGDDIIPEEYFELRYFNGEEDQLHPFVRRDERPMERSVHSSVSQRRESVATDDDSVAGMDVRGIIENQLPPQSPHSATPKSVNDFFSFWRTSKRKWFYVLGAVAILILYAFSVKSCTSDASSWISSHWSKDSDKEKVSEPSTEEIEIANGESKSVDVSVALEGDDDVKWESSKPRVATVKDGVIKAKSEGKAEIHAFVDGILVNTWIVTVVKPEEINPLVLNFYDVALIEGAKSEPIIDEAHDVAFTSSNPQIATVSQEGVILAIKNGEATITASKDGHDVTCHVIVNKPEAETLVFQAVKILRNHSGSLKVGEQWKIPFSTSDGVAISFKSSSDSIAIIDKNGNIKALKPGKTTLNLLVDGRTVDTYELTVKEK